MKLYPQYGIMILVCLFLQIASNILVNKAIDEMIVEKIKTKDLSDFWGLERDLREDYHRIQEEVRSFKATVPLERCV